MQNKLIIANWKENPDNLDTARKLLNISTKFKEQNSAFNIEITHAVPTLYAGIFKKENSNSNVILQNVSKFSEGSHTGEISVKQAKNLSIEMSLAGHSETRLSPNNPQGDENKDVNLKIKNLLQANMFVTLCIGEYIRDENYKTFLQEQIKESLEDIPQEKFNKIIFAYEPVWAIGERATRPASISEIKETILYIRSVLLQYDPRGSSKMLYGGSVDEKNALEILSLDCVDGLLVGRASSDPDKWSALLNSLI